MLQAVSKTVKNTAFQPVLRPYRDIFRNRSESIFARNSDTIITEKTLLQLKQEVENNDKEAWYVCCRCVVWNSRIFWNIILGRYPAPVTAVISVLRSVKYIRESISALLHGKLSVAVLDGAAVAVSILRGDFSTASSVMFMLGLGEILEDWMHKKSVADLAGVMSLNVDKVWLKAGDEEVLVPVTSVSTGDCICVRTGSMIPLDGKVVSGETMVYQASCRRPLLCFTTCRHSA